MQKLFDEVTSLDARCYEDFHLSEDVLMEHAAEGMARYITNNFSKDTKIIIAVGSGNNGADGIALGRLLFQSYDVSLLFVKEPKSKMALLQAKRAKSIGVPSITSLRECDVIVDAIVGSGFSGEFNPQLRAILNTLNAATAFKIACDIPSGLQADGVCTNAAFVADITLTMGALKKSLFLDEAKDFTGKIEVLDLGISRKIYETKTSWHLLDNEDLKLPHRSTQNTHKGSFGHLCILSGEKIGASVFAAQAALRLGAGLVTLITHEKPIIPFEIMYANSLPKNSSAIALGMGLGESFSNDELKQYLNHDLPLIIDADIFYMPIVLELLKRSEIILTPHPKEFVALLKLTKLADISVEELQKKRFHYAEIFSQAYPNAVLLLKGANVIIAYNGTFFINPHGSSKLAKGGSGDVLAGLIGSLLAQGYSTLNAALNGSLAHTKLAQNYTLSDFSLTPNDLIEGIGKL
ncbi:NAD(P)H-hydrate dehydratase [Sulfurimonas sp.]|uniref:NAD(P)H-hydrate dehydratase n=1 Tax=Sulfurimonas sp. TaxID=2022749 RepID=UPI0026117B3B|nr:NAD(P)H-hydrate dehydratase [Sulfurimonas sp.]